MAALRAGDELVVRGGVYREIVAIRGKAGASGARIVIRAFEGERPVIDGSGTKASAVVAIGESSWIRFEGFEVRNGSKSGISVDDATHVELRGNDVHDNQTFGIHLASTGENLFGKTRSIVVEGNRVHRNVLDNAQRRRGRMWAQGIGTWRARDVDIVRNSVSENYGEGIDIVASDGCRVRENEVFDNYSVNVYLDNATHVLVDGNDVATGRVPSPERYYREGMPAMGIHASNEDYAPPNPLDYVEITNNVVLRCLYGFSFHASSHGGLRRTRIARNTFVLPLKLGIYVEDGNRQDATVTGNIFVARNGARYAYAGSDGLRFERNCWWGGLADSRIEGRDDVIADPRLADANGTARASFVPRRGSPCEGLGASAATPALSSRSASAARR